MRIISGKWRGQNLKAPSGMRPTTDRVKEAIFSILGDAENLDVLDLFAGSGALGIEALSRGARSAVFVDISRDSLRCIQANLAGKDIRNYRLIRRDAMKFLHSPSPPFHWIFCDPPYDKVNYPGLLTRFADSAAMNHSSLLILESSRFHALALPPALEEVDQRKFGDTVVHFIRRADGKPFEVRSA
jgi:16S rRNA (guanine966-N2)-methyltransferase